jgi:5-methylcytosine-specific restriction enzyme A
MRAPKHCGYHSCTVIVYPPANRCTDHASGWKTSPRTASSQVTRTRVWRATRIRALERDQYRCQIRGPKCLGAADQVDHVIPVFMGGSDDIEPSKLLCAMSQHSHR